ncbi:response regulator [Rhodoferax sp.]|uniref:response regulator n=1 Tax=Rhodoferax sp. TaxID=50421 RepID=UPI002ACE515C|nr:response regulator [Rhodoferax sp.]MDZ7921075.1 response regulator [Rhodoferax sp.]
MALLNKFRSLFQAPTAPAAPLPIVDPTGQLPERRVRPRLNARPDLRIVVIDDSATVCAALRKILQSIGLNVRIAGDAENGLAMVMSDPPDLIFLDIVLPQMNGFSALRVLRRNALTRAIPVIMISGNEQATEQFFGSAIGADDFMKKPFSRLEVFERIERLLDEQHVPRRKTPMTMPAPLAT